MFYEKFEELRYSAQEDSQWDGADADGGNHTAPVENPQRKYNFSTGI